MDKLNEKATNKVNRNRRIRDSIAKLILSIIIIACPTMMVYAESGSYDSTYEMYGGLYSNRTWDATNSPSFTVSNWNCQAVYNANIIVQLERKITFGWSYDDYDYLNSLTPGSCSLQGNGAGKYRIYLHQESGDLMKGNIRFSWTW